AAFVIARIVGENDLAQVVQTAGQERQRADILGRLQALCLLLDARGQALVQRRAPAYRVAPFLAAARELERPAGHPNGAALTRIAGLVRLASRRCALHALALSHGPLAPLPRARSRRPALQNRDTCRSW